MRYYVYELVCCQSGRVVYVGKGKGDRMYEHLRYARRTTPMRQQRYLYTKLKEMLDAGIILEPKVVYRTDDEHDALVSEARLIRHYGFENLLNSASHAFLGRTLKPGVRRAISAKIKELWRSEDYRTRNAAARTGRRYPYRSKLACRRPKNSRIGESGYKGVSKWSSPGKSIRWLARITIKSVFTRIGYFKEPGLAAKAYDDACEKEYGNRPNGT